MKITKQMWMACMTKEELEEQNKSLVLMSALGENARDVRDKLLDKLIKDEKLH